MADEEALNSYYQVRDKYFRAVKANNRNNEMLAVLEKSVMHTKLVLGEMSRLPADVVTYKNVGKAYLFTPKSKIVSQYEDSFKANEDQLKQARADRDTYKKQIASVEGELKECLQSHPALAAQLAEA